MYAKSSIDETEYSKTAYERKEKILLFDKLKASGCSESLALEAIKIPRSTFYRWKKNYKELALPGLEKGDTAPHRKRERKWPPSLEQMVLNLRRNNPLYGKAKIKVLLERDWNVKTSVSTVGRIISKLIKNDLVKNTSYYSAYRRKQPRYFNGHAQRWKKGMKAAVPGELVQIDHMTISMGSTFTIKHFQAVCPVTKLVVEEAYSSATSNIASQFLNRVRQQMPFAIISIQVDGGSEFKGEFEQACEISAIPLYVLPPKSPECNGVVERANGSAKFEFYHCYQGDFNLANLRQELKRYVQKYNTYRPHQALQYLTPWEYYKKLEASKVSNVMN